MPRVSVEEGRDSGERETANESVESVAITRKLYHTRESLAVLPTRALAVIRVYWLGINAGSARE